MIAYEGPESPLEEKNGERIYQFIPEINTLLRKL